MTELVSPVVVRRMHEGRHSWIEPGLDTAQPEHAQAAWHAAVLRADTGVDVSIYSGALNGTRDYNVVVPGVSSSGPCSLRELPIFLHGISVGLRAASLRSSL